MKMRRAVISSSVSCVGSGSRVVSRQCRNADGIQLVELLVAIVVSGLIVSAITSSLMQMMSFSSNGQNQLMASDIAQEVIDNSRNMSFNRLVALCDQPQPITLLCNRKSEADSTDPYGAFPRPLSQDWVNMRYHQDAANGALSKTQTNRFRGDVTDGGLVQQRLVKSIVNGVTTVSVEVQIQWKDGRNAGHSYKASTLIADNGIHN